MKLARPADEPSTEPSRCSAERSRSSSSAIAASSFGACLPASPPPRLRPDGASRNRCGSQCSASALARSSRERLPWATRISPIRPPFWRWTSSAASSCDLVTKPSSTKISPMGRLPSAADCPSVCGPAMSRCDSAVSISPSIGNHSVECEENRISRRRPGRPRSRMRTRRPARGRGAAVSSGCAPRVSSPWSR